MIIKDNIHTQSLRNINTFHISDLESMGSFRAHCMFNNLMKGGIKE